MTDRTDNFNRADSSSSLGTPSDGGSAWTAHVGTWGINSNQAYCSSVTSLACASVESSISDCEVQATLAVVGSAAGLVARLADSNNYILADEIASTVRLFKNVAGSFTSLGSYSGTTANGDVIKWRGSGSSHTVYQNGVSRITATDSAGSSNTKHGIRTHNDTTMRIDDFSATALAAGGPVIPVFMNQYRQRWA